MSNDMQIIGGQGIHVGQFGRSWVIDIDPSFIPLPAALGVASYIDPEKIEDLTFIDEHPETLLTGKWDRTQAINRDGVSVTIQTGEAYDHEGDRTLYAFFRDFTFNANGRLQSISAERRVVIDAAEAS